MSRIFIIFNGCYKRKGDEIKRCRNCYITDALPNVKINEERICNYCLEGREINPGFSSIAKVPELKKNELKKEFEEYIEKIKGKSEYDCLLLLSGGKDSGYLLYLLKEKYKLNILALTVNTGLEKNVTLENSKKIAKHFGVDYLLFTPEGDLFKRCYKFYLTHHFNKTYVEVICPSCSALIYSIGLNIAAKKKIPFVTLGFSPHQARFHEFSKEDLYRSWIPKELFNEFFSEKDRSYFWNPENIDEKNTPRLILPFYFLEYPGVEKIIKTLSNLGLGSTRKFNPLKTNCYLVSLLIRLDLIKYGYFNYTKDLCSLIRNGKIKQRKKYFLILTLGVWLLKHGFVRRGDVKHVLRYLDLKLKDIIK